VVMNNGLVEQIGAPLDVYEKPASTFVASFIGAPPMNLLPLTGGADGHALKDGQALASAAFDGSAATLLGFRPEDAVVGADGHSFALDFHVLAVEPVGAESYLHGEAAGSQLIVRVAGRTAAKPGDRMPVSVADGKLHAFDAAGKRIERAEAGRISGQAAAVQAAPA
jgi:sn-glycerol 3-phosphate transport system ATP-binding protein